MDPQMLQMAKMPGIKPPQASALKKIGIETVRDLFFHFPFRYEDYSVRTPVAQLTEGQMATVMGEVLNSEAVRTWKKRMRITTAEVADETGSVRAVWFNQPYLAAQLKTGMGLRLSGKVSLDKNGLFFSNPSWERSSREPTNTGRLVPVYGETEGITSRFIRWKLGEYFKYAKVLKDPLPADLLEKLHLPDLHTALEYIHFPKTQKHALLAQKRFAFQQMFLVQLSSLSSKHAWEKRRAQPLKTDSAEMENFIEKLPFALTGAQRKATAHILKDLALPRPMNRLLNGDVGSGKTVVAALAALAAVRANCQVSLMAPTEVLAKQHFESFAKFFSAKDVSVGLLTNSYQIVSQNNAQPGEKFSRPELLEKIKSGKIDIIIGTHALIQKDVVFKNLALVIVDEQHRFGVSQRAYLQQEVKTIPDGLPGKMPHLLSMTATPIPRTLSLAFFGNLDISVLDEMPQSRKPIITELVTTRKRQEVYDFVKKEIAAGRQAFVVLPLVDESEKMSEVKAATAEHKRLSREVFPELSLGLLHGKLKAAEKERVMESFKAGKYDILVATSVVEVGIDVPNSTIMLIEDAERFGLSQLHQFRGRVGRGAFQSYCFLFTSKSATAERLRALVKHADGFSIAEKDLELRGPGELLGTRQSGIPDIAMEHIANVKLIEISRESAENLLTQDPFLAKHPLLKKELAAFSKDVHLE